MLRRLSLAALPLIALAAFAACGDGPDDGNPTPTTPPQTATTPAGSSSPGATGTPVWPGPAPTMGKNITGVTPEHGTAVTQADTRSPDPGRPRGVCIEANFSDIPETEDLLWYRMVLGETEVTGELTWVVSTQDNPEGGRGCYAPAEGLAPGRYEVSVAVQNPSNVNEPTRELVTWRFEVR